MHAPHNSVETMLTNHSTNIEQNARTILRKNEDNFMTVQSTVVKGQERKKRKLVTDSTSSSSMLQRYDNVLKRCFRWCTKCCRKQKSKRARKKKKTLWKRLKEKREKCRSKKRRIYASATQSSTTTAGYSDSEEIKEKRRRRAKKTAKFDDSSVVDPRSFDDEHVITDHGLEKDFVDFTKSCCYLCAKNTMAIAAAISNNVGKSNISIQASTHFVEKSTSVKSGGPGARVRTVQSSVKVKMRDMSTLYPERKKPKRTKGKFKLKKLNIFSNLKAPKAKRPKVRTVACETDKSSRRNNVPQCRARRGTYCVREDK
ncbi:uncharacterized protein LOC143346081 [Colletes latitarsis]|uniref:uncharacterized protein LOC143346081 n=1 Tax=Colletes latitarsis TaxID=2605962 RepID=UPI004035EC47